MSNKLIEIVAIKPTGIRSLMARRKLSPRLQKFDYTSKYKRRRDKSIHNLKLAEDSGFALGLSNFENHKNPSSLSRHDRCPKINSNKND